MASMNIIYLFIFNPIYNSYVIFLDNLTLSERVEKRDNNNPINSNNPREDP